MQTAIQKKINWNPDYKKVIRFREKRNFLISCSEREAVLERYKNDYILFIEHFGITYDPRRKLKKMPFVLFPKQIEFAHWLHKKFTQQKSGLCEKSRDMGATWVCVAFAVWAWMFVEGAAIRFGSYKADKVDKLGNPDSIFEKLRMQIAAIPEILLPIGYDEEKHSLYMRILNPEGGGTIIGESGENIGRGGRSQMYIKDESAHYDNAEKIEAALSENTDCQIDVSSVNGPNNIFYRRRHSGSVDVFVMDWSDHPLKTQEWYNERKEKAEKEGLYHLFAQEVDRDYTSAVEGILIPSSHITAAIDAHIKLGFEKSGVKRAGMDVADEGRDMNGIAKRHGVVVDYARQWPDKDPAEAGIKAINFCEDNNVEQLIFDSNGVGAGVKGQYRQMVKDRKEKKQAAMKVSVRGWAAQGKVKNKKKKITDGRTNEDFFSKANAQEWWAIKTRFHKTHRAVTMGVKYDPSELISISSEIDSGALQELKAQLSQIIATYDGSGKVVIIKTPKGTTSPNLADSFMISFVDVPQPTLTFV